MADSIDQIFYTVTTEYSSVFFTSMTDSIEQTISTVNTELISVIYTDWTDNPLRDDNHIEQENGNLNSQYIFQYSNLFHSNTF